MAVYFIQESAAGYIKIGTGCPYNRMRAMSTGNPWELKILKIIDGSYKEEGVVHRIFSKDRLYSNREWFRPSKELLLFINSRRETIYKNIKVAGKYLEDHPKHTFHFAEI